MSNLQYPDGTAKQKTLEYQRKLLAESLSQCTPKQQELFDRIYPRDRFPKGVPDKDLESAINLILRTLSSNTNLGPEGEKP